MRKQIFTVLAALGGLVCMHAQVTVSQGEDVKAAIEGASSGDVRIEAGVYKLSGEITVPAGVTVIGGFVGGFTDANRIYPGGATTTQLTILDGNSFETAKAAKHRVATVNGTLEGVVVRGGHQRQGHGGGLLVNSGAVVANCIIKGNVAMTVKEGEAESLGGGVYLNGGTLVNSVVAYNMANNGYGVAGNGKVVNNTITANTYAPEAVKVAGATYKHYKHWRTAGSLPWALGATPLYDDTEIIVSDFYLSATQTTTSQYAVFAASLDLEILNNDSKVTLPAGAKALKDLIDPSSDPLSPVTVDDRMNFTDANVAAVLFQESKDAGYGLRKVGNDFIYYPNYSNNAMANVTWFGGLAYSVWIGGTLPTEGQWELAARSNGTPTLDIYMYAGGDVLNDVAWFSGSGRVQDVADTRKAPTALGLYDMSGNVWEWCADVINSTAESGSTAVYPTDSQYAGGSAIDPIYTNGSSRVARGGSWNLASGYLALAFRYSTAATAMSAPIGFRPVLVP